MTESRADRSLLAGRRSEQLSSREITQVANLFLGLDATVPAYHDSSQPSGFRVEYDEDLQEEVGRVGFGPDIFPGVSVADPNAALSVQAAVAHEICHYHRWVNQTNLPLGRYRDLDEAMTSLEALLRFGGRPLSALEVEQLARDALLRLQRLRAQLFADPEPPEDLPVES